MGKPAPLFTVFTPTFNRAGVLRRPYESLRGQTLRDFEWLVIDDGSTDNTRQLVEGWQQEADFPIRYVWQENASKAAAWNRALELAWGEFFVCLDSDDGCVPEALASFKEHWGSIPEGERNRFSGVTALALDQNGTPYGPDLPRSPLDCSHLAVVYRLKRFHESWQCYRTEVIKKYRFDLIPEYRNYLPETTFINRVAVSYIQRHINQRLRIYHTDEQPDIGEHLSCGVSPNASLKHAPGYRAAHLSLLKYQFKWFPIAPVQFYKAATNYIRFSWMQGISVRTQLTELGSMRARALWLSALPAATVLRIRDRRAEREKIRAQVDGELRPAVLYITYDGLMEPLGQSQVLPYLRGLASEYAITILSFEKPNDLANLEQRKTVEEQLEKAAIGWIPLRYHKRPSAPATAFDIAHGVIRCVAFALRRHPQIVHVRGYVPGVIGLTLKRVAGVRLIFDMRGFWPDEKVDAGAWRRDSLLYRAAKRVEKSLLQRADVVVSLTQAGVTEMKKFPYLRMQQVRYEVIPTCTDLELFHPTKYSNNRGQKEFVLGYVGSVGTFYAFERVVEFFKAFAESCEGTRLLIVNRHGHPYIRSVVSKYGLAPDSVEVVSCDYAQVPAQIGRMDAGVFFTARHLSHAATAPTRLGEMLGCGVPSVVNPGMGDTDEILIRHRTGVLVRSYDQQGYQEAVRGVLSLCSDSGIQQRCVQCAHEYFSLKRGVAAYNSIYNDLTERSEPVTKKYGGNS